MRVISTSKQFAPILDSINKVVDKKSKLPDIVFKSDLRYFFFSIDGISVSTSFFYDTLTNFLRKTNEEDFYVSVLDPDPIEYFGLNYNYYASIVYSVLDSAEVFFDGLNNYPTTNSADAIAINSERVVVSSSSCKWAFFLDRDTEIEIFAFSNKSDKELFKKLYSPYGYDSARDAVENSYVRLGTKEQIETFCKNYAQPET